jgi:hypothetical protein
MKGRFSIVAGSMAYALCAFWDEFSLSFFLAFWIYSQHDAPDEHLRVGGAATSEPQI